MYCEHTHNSDSNPRRSVSGVVYWSSQPVHLHSAKMAQCMLDARNQACGEIADTTGQVLLKIL